jgi:histidine triad (HIT) family protein
MRIMRNSQAHAILLCGSRADGTENEFSDYDVAAFADVPADASVLISSESRARNMATSTTCIFCEIVARRLPATIVFEDAEHLAFFPLEHINPGHLLLIPKRHVDYLFEMDAPALHALWSAAAELAPGLRAVTAAKRVGVAVEGFAVPHVHVHLVPLHAPDELNPTRAKSISQGETDRLAKLLREAFDA